MADTTPTSADVVEAIPEDVTCILAWLKREYDEDDGEGFWCNHNVISGTLDKPGDLWVIRRNREAVAFQVGKYKASILSVRKDNRKAGMGKALVQASIERAMRDDVNALSVQCRPEESFGFWERMGFVRYGNLESCSYVKARRILTRTYDLPATSSPIDVVIGFYPGSAKYGGAENVPPMAEHRTLGVRLDDGSIMLDQRVIGLSRYGTEAGDTVVKIEVDGVGRCFCKCKYADARAVGVQYDEAGGTFFIDCITSEDNG